MARTRETQLLLEGILRAEEEEFSEAARDEAQRLLLARHLARLGRRTGGKRATKTPSDTVVSA